MWAIAIIGTIFLDLDADRLSDSTMPTNEKILWVGDLHPASAGALIYFFVRRASRGARTAAT